MTGFKIKHNNITQQCNFDVQLTSSALNQLRKHCLLAKETFGGVLVLWGRPKNSPVVKRGGTMGHCGELCSGPTSCPWGWFMSGGQSFGVYIRFSVCCFEQLLLHLSDWAAPAEVQAEAKAEDFHPPRRSAEAWDDRVLQARGAQTQQQWPMPEWLLAGVQGSAGKVVQPCLPLQPCAQACLNKMGAFISCPSALRTSSSRPVLMWSFPIVTWMEREEAGKQKGRGQKWCL